MTSVAVSGDGRVIVSWSEDRTVLRWDGEIGESGESVGEPLRGHAQGVSSMAVSGDRRAIFSGSWDETVQRQSGESVGEPLRGHEGGELGGGEWGRERICFEVAG